MALAETAQLAVNLTLQGNFNSGISTAERELAGLNATAATSSSKVVGAFGSVRGAALTAGGALSHAGGQIKSLLTGPLGFIGLSTGLLAVSGAIKEGLGKADEFSLAIEKLQGLTNDSADSLSQLIAVTDNYGISADRLTKVVGFTEKALGNIATTAGGAANFAKQYGFAITDVAGKVLPFNDILLKAADFYNSNADQSTKAAVTAKLFGRSYADLVPILKLGSQGIKDAEQSAKDLGITLTATNVNDLKKYRETTRTLGDAMTGLQLQIGLGLVPAFTDLATSLTHFISDHRTDIVAFFRNAVDAGRKIAGVIGDVASGLSSAWNAIPAPLRDFLLKGLVADRTIKFLFGFDPIAALGKGLLGSLGGTLLSRGSPANPMFVVAEGGLGGAGAAGVGKLGGFLGKVAIVGGVALAAATIIELKQALDQQSAANAQGESALTQQTTKYISSPTTSRSDIMNSIRGIEAYRYELTNGSKAFTAEGLAFQLNIDHIKDTVDAQLAALKAKLAEITPGTHAPGAGVAPPAKLTGKAADDIALSASLAKKAATAADQKETSRIVKQSSQTVTTSVNYAKIDISRKVDTTTNAVVSAQTGIVTAIQALAAAMHVTISISDIVNGQKQQDIYRQPTVLNKPVPV